MNEQYKEAVDGLIGGFDYMLQENNKKSTQIFNGVITAVNGSSYTIKLNGNEYVIPLYGGFIHNVNDVVKVFIPQGNMNLAFFM